jgi:threonine synthase
MDIAKSSNFERMIFDVCEFDSEQVKWFYDELQKTWKYQVPPNILAKIKETFISSTSTNEERLNTIRTVSEVFNHWIDPHTAAWVVPVLKWDHFLWSWETPVIFLETSHVAQFGAELEREWIVVPWTKEFDRTLNAMRQANPREWVDFFNVSWDFDETFKVIEWIINNWPKK